MFTWYSVFKPECERGGENRLLGLSPSISEKVRLVWGLRISISNKFPGSADAAGPEVTILEPLA